MAATFRRLTVVVPAYNEARTLAEVVARVKAVELGGLEREIIVVDDGSTDGTADEARALPDVKVVAHAANGGKGKAVKAGFAAATGDILLIQDADLEYAPADYPEVLRPILEGRADAVMGSRFAHERPKFFFGGGSPFFTHYLGNRVIIALTNLLYGQRATDYEGGTKAFVAAAVRDLAIEADGFEYDNELICKLLRKGKRVLEVPIQYRPRGYDEGKKITWRHGLKMLWTIARWRFKRF